MLVHQAKAWCTLTPISRKEHDMKIIGGKIRLGRQVIIELDDGKVITRKVQSTGRNCSI